jgi:outer membrane lipoprotein LolB
VDDPDTPRSFAAHFDLQGSANNGRLELSTPLGTLLARLQWSVGEASIETAQERRSAATLSALLREVTGEALPIDALFDWLSGVPTLAGGWQADLQQLDEGRLSATRTQPPPAAMLRILLNP